MCPTQPSDLSSQSPSVLGEGKTTSICFWYWRQSFSPSASVSAWRGKRFETYSTSDNGTLVLIEQPSFGSLPSGRHRLYLDGRRNILQDMALSPFARYRRSA